MSAASPRHRARSGSATNRVCGGRKLRGIEGRKAIVLLSDGDDPAENSGYQDHPDDRIWRTANISNEKLARRIVEEGLDVLVDLNGYSAQRRLPLTGRAPASARARLSGFELVVHRLG